MKSNIAKFIFSFSFLIFANCYFNPLVNSIVSPEKPEDADPLTITGIAAAMLSPQIVQITGQIVDANGLAVVNGNLTILTRTNPIDGLSESFSLNSAGRFFIQLSTGETRIRVDQSSVELFTFTFTISGPGMISISNKSLTGPEILNLEFYQTGFTPSYFDILSMNPFDKATFTTWPSTIQISFSEDLELPSNMQNFLDANVFTSPTITMDGSGSSIINNNILEIWNSSGFQIGANTYSFGSGILSISGKKLSPRTITFTCNSPCNPP
ncbi:carboxypeptidase regulatory-like domain-containing protein [Leptospira biflexa]|uniref:carboxypeptidase regulatory-like domain-containing protein n=1 Tax=Leptospira biflexa TaxID=172 RepID=UPI001090E925|nr:carboxypeptidase regulatory-like domain-containing protein [Leptospira biflexa]TGM46586.1 carboxypeptidase regulatory-like domain-containing protein [Leptospira biflexa]TGM50951.1 carboxypeptidase regulatory-like domain-containing protein [Leptospira biflexa]TGM56224.1 carboxypeptidase regulatory-like domain-containing protein [Leptospira biflexa]